MTADVVGTGSFAGLFVAHARAGDGVRNWVPAVGTAALAATYVALFPGGMA